VFVANFLILMQLGAKHVELSIYWIWSNKYRFILFLLYSLMNGVTLVENTFVYLRHKK
jgi:hypothetical protein